VYSICMVYEYMSTCTTFLDFLEPVKCWILVGSDDSTGGARLCSVCAYGII